MARVTSPPPLTWLIAYRLFGVRLPEEYRAWAAEDTKSKLFPVWRTARTFLGLLALIALYAIAQTKMYQAPAQWTLKRCALGALAVAILGTGPMQVRRTLRWQRVDKQGNPVRPRGFARHGNVEAAGVLVIVALLWTGGSALLGYGLRPAASAFDGVPCQTPDQATMSLINAGLTHQKATFMATREITFQTGVMVGGLLTEPPSDKPDPKTKLKLPGFSYETWIVEGGEVHLYNDNDRKEPTWTKFPPATAVDRVASEARARVAFCVASVLKK
jgi:hypothetical protein